MRTSLSILSYSKRKPRWTVLWSILAIALTAVTVQRSQAQECTIIIINDQGQPEEVDITRPNGYCPEPAPRPGEKRANTFVYKATHNSFQRDNDMDVQINTFNTFMVELDIHYLGNGGYVVQHDCCDNFGAQTLTEAFDEIDAAPLDNRVVFIYLQQCDDCLSICFECFEDDNWPSRATYFAQIKDKLDDSIDADFFYRHQDFRDIDDKAWPSLQELIRRGQHVVVFFQEKDSDGHGAPSTENFFFGVSLANPPTDCCNFALSNMPGGNDCNPITQYPSIPDGTAWSRWFHRVYPESDWDCWFGASDCDENDDDYWDFAVHRGYNFVATNCDEGHVTDPATHSPLPIYIDAGFDFACVGTGTQGVPYIDYTGLLCALERVSPAVDIRMAGGLYSPLVASSLVISNPMAIKSSDGGIVTINPGR